MSTSDTPFSIWHTNTADDPSDPYDHAISLVDTTLPQAEPASPSRSSSPSNLAKKSTLTSVREHLAKRKYAKWQREGSPSRDEETKAADDTIQPSSPNSRTGSSQIATVADGNRTTEVETEATDFAPQPETPDRGRNRPPNERTSKHKYKEQRYEVDILYENQRGLFFFGIPLYSHSSLLNCDPAPWVTKDLKDSAVNITNAQVPDPSWEWAWKSWYVDMSYDVDEEGWQYSFLFGRKWTWHGSHPWYHSFVRRRRWLRKRVKCHGDGVDDWNGRVHEAHALTGDYFSIHPKRDKSPTSTLETTARTSYTGQRAAVDDPPEDIDNISNLMKALRLATIDREKIDVIKKFLKQGGEELAYLEGQIPEIVSLFVFQTSRRQLVELLQREAADAQKHRDEHLAENRPESETESRRIDNLLKAMRTANNEISRLEYWSDRKHALQFSDEAGSNTESKHDLVAFDGASTAPTQDDPVEEIEGLSEKAELDIDPTRSATHTDSSNASAAKVEDEDKGKAKETAGDDKDGGYTSFNSGDPSNRLRADTVVLSEEGTGIT